jgi:hypothetical protein
MERLIDFLQILLEEKTNPTKQEVLAEIKAIPALRSIPILIDFPTAPVDQGPGFFFMLKEDYVRYDDVLPDRVMIYALPAEMDDQKMLDRIVTSKTQLHKES